MTTEEHRQAILRAIDPAYHVDMNAIADALVAAGIGLLPPKPKRWKVSADQHGGQVTDTKRHYSYDFETAEQAEAVCAALNGLEEKP